MEELRECPFCGGEAYLDKATEDYPNYVAGCKNCRVHTAWHSTKNGAVIMWNTRIDNWISVDEKLPTVDPRYGDIDVLVHMDDGFIATATFSGDWELWAESGEVTHWQPLPGPPKGSE